MAQTHPLSRTLRSLAWGVLVAGTVGTVGALGSACAPREPPAPEPRGASDDDDDDDVLSVAPINPRLLRRFQAVAGQEAAAPVASADVVDLGRMLWFDTRLSRNRDLSCNSCHDLQTFGVDNRARSPGHNGKLGRRNTPSVYDAGARFVQFWDGRAPTLEAQAPGPIENLDEMALSGPELLARLGQIPAYRQRFDQAFGPSSSSSSSSLTMAHVADALAAFERGLVTRGRWDDYLAGDASVLQDREIAGLRVFLNVGCVACHTGPQVGASMFQTAGVFEPWPDQRDQGRFEITGNPADKMVFRVPSLKNIAKTAPYFHDGSAATLPEAVRTMARVQLGVTLDDEEVDAVVAFLGALTGELPTTFIEQPALPPDPDTVDGVVGGVVGPGGVR